MITKSINGKDVRIPEVGDVVIYHDTTGNPHNALITEVHANIDQWFSDYGPCVNVLHVSGDKAKRDQYGTQIERPSSVSHGSCPGTAHGYYYRWADEPVKRPVK